MVTQYDRSVIEALTNWCYEQDGDNFEGFTSEAWMNLRDVVQGLVNDAKGAKPVEPAIIKFRAKCGDEWWWNSSLGKGEWHFANGMTEESWCTLDNFTDDPGYTRIS